MSQFPITLLHWSQISFPEAFFWGLPTASSHWGPYLENRMGVEAIWSTIHVVFSLLWSTHDMVHCLGERALFPSSFVAIFWQFLPSNALIKLYNICYWWFFLSQYNWWTKYLACPKIQRPKPSLLMFASLVALDGFHLLLSTQLTADLTLEWSGGSMFHPLSHIYAKTPFCCIETVANYALNRRCVIVFDQLWANTPPTSTSCISTELLYIGSSWSSNLCSSMWRGPQEYITYEFVLTSPALSCMSVLSNLDSFHDGW